MPYITLNTGAKKAKIYYEDTAPDNQDKPVIFFAHGLLWSCRMWDDQVKVLEKRYRCIRMDFRGQGQSGISKSGYDMDSLADDITALLDHLKVDKFHFVGLSMGGFVGQRMALNHPERLQKLVLLDTSADPEPEENLPGYGLLVKIASVFGPKIIMRDLVKIMHGQTFLQEAKKDKEAKARLKLFKQMMGANRRRAVKKIVSGVTERDGVYDRIQDIRQPTLVLVGDEDVATVPAKSQRIHTKIDGSKLILIENAGHMSPMERPTQVTKYINEFLAA